MKYKLSTTRSIGWLRAGTAGTTLMLACAWTSPALAVDVTANKKCRAGIGTQLTTVIKKGMTSQEKCFALAAKYNIPSSICTDPTTFPFMLLDGTGYLKAQNTAEKNLITKTPGTPLCPSATTPETLDNYVDNDTGSVYDNLSKLLAFSADYIIGTAALNGDKAVATCQKTIAAARRDIATTMLSEAFKCQKTKDAGATLAGNFAGLNRVTPDCLNETTPVTNKITANTTKITAKCGSLSPAQLTTLGACSPLPTCVVDAARATGRNLALAAYPSQTCDPNPSLVANGRTVTVALDVPAGITLSGADVRVNYPRFQAGVPGNGTETDPIDLTGVASAPFTNATDKDGSLDVNLLWGSGFSGSGVAFRVKMDKCEDFSKGLCSTTTSATCSAQKDCAPHCLERASGGTANNTNTACQVDTDCPASGATSGYIQKCVCPGCSQKHCVGPNNDATTNASCNWNTECDGRCAGKEFAETGGTCQTDLQCGFPIVAGSCRHVKGCSDYLRSVCTADADCNGGTAPVCTSGKCSAGPLAGVAACTTAADCVIGHCSATNSANAGRNCAVANVKTDCGGHCSTTTSMVCNTNSQCPQSPVAETCVFGTCDTSSPASGLCNLGNPVSGPTGGGSFCMPVENCNAQDEVCSVSQYLGCGAPSDPACPAGEQCVTQAQLTTCTVLSALDDGANEVDGVTCTIGVQGHCSLSPATLCNTDNQCLPSGGTCVQP